MAPTFHKSPYINAPDPEIPVAIVLSRSRNIAASKVLIPLSFASQFGGVCTLVGTSTNLLVVNVAADMGMDSFNMFDFLGPASVAGFFAVLYLWLVVPRIVPERQPPMSGTVSRLYTAQIRLDAGSPVVARTLAEALREAGLDVTEKSYDAEHRVIPGMAIDAAEFDTGP